MLNLNDNLSDIVIKKVVRNNQSDMINHLKIIMEYSKYDICSKSSRNTMCNRDFYTYYFKYRIRYKRKVQYKFIKLMIMNNFKL